MTIHNLGDFGLIMELLEVVILAIHPLAALALLWVFFQQHNWRKRSLELKGEKRLLERTTHEQRGKKLLNRLLIIMGLGFLGKGTVSLLRGGASITAFLPSSLHGITAIIGALIFYSLWKLGNKIVGDREAGEKYHGDMKKHGKIADVLLLLGCLHGFIGFLYFFNSI